MKKSSAKYPGTKGKSGGFQALSTKGILLACLHFGEFVFVLSYSDKSPLSLVVSQGKNLAGH